MRYQNIPIRMAQNKTKQKNLTYQLLTSSWSNTNSHSLLVGLKNSIAIQKDSFVDSSEAKYNLTIQSSSSTTRYLRAYVVIQSCPTLCNSTDCSPAVSSYHGIFQSRIMEWVVISSSRVSSQSRDQNHVSCTSCIDRQVLYYSDTWEAVLSYIPK